jgi:hypothetical protein
MSPEGLVEGREIRRIPPGRDLVLVGAVFRLEYELRSQYRSYQNKSRGPDGEGRA